MRKIKVLIANQPRLMRELVVATVSDQPDIEIVGVLEDEASILGTVEQSPPDVLIVGLDRSDDRPHICDILLERFPHMRILALAAERNSTMFYWASLDIRSNRIENSEASILSALRGRKLVVSTVQEPESKLRAN
jgi:chemotaxis response regulator CheB